MVSRGSNIVFLWLSLGGYGKRRSNTWHWRGESDSVILHDSTIMNHGLDVYEFGSQTPRYRRPCALDACHIQNNTPRAFCYHTTGK